MSQSPATEGMKVFESGAVRSNDADDTRYDLISPVGLRRLAQTYAEGAAKYTDHNWRNGMPFSELLNHAERHINLYKSGDTSEDHLAHAAWNLFAAMDFEETRPELQDLFWRVSAERREQFLAESKRKTPALPPTTRTEAAEMVARGGF